ncbi:MAG: hypothetical protein RBG13Loki_1286 [Promethearchaeota archaeon CR_4]|nr:MAG: hypothetical protein RBG13Loki_1286 [Candidatus Lokiarchaeota archaeon CR_4]
MTSLHSEGKTNLVRKLWREYVNPDPNMPHHQIMGAYLVPKKLCRGNKKDPADTSGRCVMHLLPSVRRLPSTGCC